MATIVRKRKLGMTSIRGIIEASNRDELSFANNYDGIPFDDIYIRWGCTSNVPNPEAKVINSARGIHRVADKSGFRRLCQAEGVPVPRTFWAGDPVPNNVYPVVVRTQTHAQGRGLWLCRDRVELQQAVRAAGQGCYINQFIDKVAEFRVFIHQGFIVWIAEKTPGNPDDVAWNVNRGGRFDNVRWDNWNMWVCDAAYQAWEQTGLHFSGIDVMIDADGRPYVLEANSAPSQTSPYRQSCVAKAFDHMLGTGLTARRIHDYLVGADSWKRNIHPAVRGAA